MLLLLLSLLLLLLHCACGWPGNIISQSDFLHPFSLSISLSLPLPLSPLSSSLFLARCRSDNGRGESYSCSFTLFFFLPCVTTKARARRKGTYKKVPFSLPLLKPSWDFSRDGKQVYTSVRVRTSFFPLSKSIFGQAQ